MSFCNIKDILNLKRQAEQDSSTQEPCSCKIEKKAKSDAKFQETIRRKASKHRIRLYEAERYVKAKTVMREHGNNADKAMLCVLENMKDETKILIIVNDMLNRGAYASACDDAQWTALHFAAKRNLTGVATKLLETNADISQTNNEGDIPLRIAYNENNDEMAALLIARMQNEDVRNLFLYKDSEPPKMSMHKLLKNPGMQKTILAVLDCLIDQVDSRDHVVYNVLECDEKGLTPDKGNFEGQDKSPFQIIAIQGNKDIVNHDAIRLLVRRKWNRYVKRRLMMNIGIYFLSLLTLTYSLIVAVDAEDPAVYDDALQISRGIMELFTLSMVAYTIVAEAKQLKIHGLEYFMDVFNWFDLSSSILLVTVPVLRFTHQNAQWHVYSFGFLFWVIRIFKFAVFKRTGAYVQIMGRVLIHDLSQFAVVFAVILLAFSGSFFLSVRGDNAIEFNEETSTFWSILFVGIRTLSEGQPVVEYTGTGAYSTLTSAFMAAFVFACCVILLNILIAQMTDTYQKVQGDAQRGLEANFAWIVAKMEVNNMCKTDFRKLHYKEMEIIKNRRDVLRGWVSQPMNETNQHTRDIWDSLDNHNMSLLTIKKRMTKQENSLNEIKHQLQKLLKYQRQSLYTTDFEHSVKQRTQESKDRSKRRSHKAVGDITPDHIDVSVDIVQDIEDHSAA